MPRIVRLLAFCLSAVFILAAGVYGWTWLNMDVSAAARAIIWRDADTGDINRFPSRTITASPTPMVLASPDNRYDWVQDLMVGSVSLDESLTASETTAFLVAGGQTLLFEKYFNGASRNTLLTSFSVAKSFVSTLVGLAVEEGLIGLDTPVTEYVPELRDTDKRYAQITIRHLITMSSGMRYSEWGLPWSDDAISYYAPDLRAAAIRAQIRKPPGEEFLYNNYNPLLIGMVLERATGMSVSEYLQNRLWHPMGAEAPGSWSLDSIESGFEKMESGLNARAVDFLKLGIVFAQGGKVSNRQVVPEEWIGVATQRNVETDPSPDYQYFWWTPYEDSSFIAIGNHGQFIYVDPTTDIVVVRMGNSYGEKHYLEWENLLHDIADKVSAH